MVSLMSLNLINLNSHLYNIILWKTLLSQEALSLEQQKSKVPLSGMNHWTNLIGRETKGQGRTSSHRDEKCKVIKAPKLSWRKGN